MNSPKSYIVPNESKDIQRLMEALTIAWEALEYYYDADYEEGWQPNKAMKATAEIERLTGRKWET